MKRRHILATVLAILLFPGYGIPKTVSAYAMESLCKEPEILFPKVWLQSAVNDVGSTVTDTDGAYCFRGFMTVTLKLDEWNSDDEERTGQFVIQRDGTDLICEDGCVMDVIDETGEYVYTVAYITEENKITGEDTLTVRGRKITDCPSVFVSYDSEPVEYGENRYFTEDPKVRVCAGSGTGIAVAEYRKENEEYVIWKDFRREDASYTYGEQTDLEEELNVSDEFSEVLTGMEDGRCSYTFRVTDVLGGTAEEKMEFIVDKTPPDSMVFVDYTSDGTNPETVSGTGIMEFLRSITDRLFGKKEVWFDLYMTDRKDDGQEPCTSSGIDMEDLCSQILTEGGKMQIRNLQSSGEDGVSFTYEGKLYEGYEHIRGCMMAPSGYEQNISDRLQIKRLRDRAGNETYGVDSECITGTTVICMDQINPVLSVDYGNGIMDAERKTVFYTKETILEPVLKEENYLNYVGRDGNPVNPYIGLVDHGGYGASVEEWKMPDPGASGVCTKLLFPAAPDTGEAEYDFTVEYQDGAGNLLKTDGVIPGEIKNGIYAGCTVVIDDRPPELILFSVEGETTGQSRGMDVYRRMEGADVKFSFGIDDHAEYWNPEAVTLTVWNLDTKKAAAVVSGNSLQWKGEGRSHLTEYVFDGEEGMKVSGYEVTISYEDRAGNRMIGSGLLNDQTEEGIYTSRGFLLDHEAPGFSITCNNAVRLVRDGDTDPSRDIMNSRPRTGYTAYYNDTIEVCFSIQEQCACPVYQRGELTGLRDFRLTVTGKNRNAYTPVVHWNKKGESYEGSFSLTEEDRYTVLAEYRDLAGNVMISEEICGNRQDMETLEDGKYESVLLVLDKTPPVFRISCVDIREKEEETVCDGNGCVFFSEAVYLKLEVEDENLRFQELLLGLERTRITDRTGNHIEDNSVGAFLKKTDRARIAEGKVVWYLPLITEAVYEFFPGCEDLSGNFTEPVAKQVCVDGTKPEMEISCFVEKTGFLDVVRYGDLRYLFADGRMTIKVSARDQTSGIRSICCTAKDENGKITEKKMDFDPASSGDFEVHIPFASSDFKGVVTAEVQDWSGNSDVQRCRPVVEDDERHRLEGGAVIITDTSPSRTVGGVDYYNTDIKFRLKVEDLYSGLKSVDCRGGKNLDYHREYGIGDTSAPEDPDIVYECQEELILDAASNNENAVVVRADYRDRAGHAGAVEQVYNIDTTVPVIEVEYDNYDVSEHGLYRQSRTATVKIRERNFDPADVEFQITNSDGIMPSIGDWQESGTGDEMLHVCHVNFQADGDYTFTLRFTDLAGNRAEYDKIDEFTIDGTEPVVTVSFDHEKNRDSEYCTQGRTAVIDILEHNFDASLIQVMVTEQKEGRVPELSEWRRDGDHNMATVRFDTDGDYTFEITGMDQAGNRMNEYGTEHFIIDQTAPVLEISGLQNMSANKGAVTPVIRCTDANYRDGDMKIWLTGCQRGLVEWDGKRIPGENGELFLAEDFAYIPEMDDLYLLSVSVCDLAGNISHEEIQFSVNRFGSVYTLDDKTEWLAGTEGMYYTNTEQDIVVTETNVDTLEFLEINCNRNGKLLTLRQDEDYYVDVSDTDVGWKQYVYRIPGRNFTEEGIYILMIYSEDRAENASDNQTKGKKIEFVMDRTAPSILLSGLEDGGQYRENSREITLDIQDNVRMSEVEVKINGVVSAYSASEVQEQDGRITLMVQSMNQWQTISVAAFDAAGNQSEEEVWFLLTPDLLVQFFMDKSLFLRIWTGFILVWAGTWALFFRQRRFRKYRGREQ